MSGKSVLVVEDNDQMRNLIASVLSGAGYQVGTARNGLEADELVAGGAAFALLVSDIIMPGKEGFETIIDMKAALPSLKVLAISGGGAIAPEEYLKSATLVGADRTMSKPIKREDLLAAVAELVGPA